MAGYPELMIKGILKFGQGALKALTDKDKDAYCKKLTKYMSDKGWHIY